MSTTTIASRRWPAPAITAERLRLAPALLLLELLALPVVVLATEGDAQLVGTGAVVALSLVLVAVPVAGLRPVEWISTWARWVYRRSAVASAARRAAAGTTRVHEVALPVRALRTGALSGPRGSEIGVLWGPGGWTSSLWVADGGVDALTRLFSQRSPGSAAVRLRSVVQQTSPVTAPGVRLDPAQQAAVPLSAWLVLHVDPIRSIRAREAVGAVPALMRSEIRSLLDHTRPGAVGLVTLDHSDLVDALAASAELPRGGSGVADAAESWSEWRAGGRTHQAFAVRRGKHTTEDVVELLLDGVTLHGGTTVTVAARHPAPGRDERYPITARVSHHDPAVVGEVCVALRRALAARGVRVRRLPGRQGPALLETTLLGSSG